MMDNIIQETIQYTRQRKIFKQPVLYHQSVRFRLAELQTEVELLRSLVHRATGRDQRRTPAGTTCSPLSFLGQILDLQQEQNPSELRG